MYNAEASLHVMILLRSTFLSSANRAENSKHTKASTSVKLSKGLLCATFLYVTPGSMVYNDFLIELQFREPIFVSAFEESPESCECPVQSSP